MKMNAAGFFLVVSCAVMAAGGCAKPEMASSEEAVGAAPSTAAKPPHPAETVQDASAQQASDKEDEMRASLAPVPGAAELNSAPEQIYFAFDSHALSREARDTLVKNARVMKADPEVKMRIEGHCDERGSDGYNLALGEKRASTAMQYLTTLGITPDRLTIVSYGEEKPAAPAHDEEAWSRNRRDEFVITRK